jgi:hypothetical protein
MKRKTALFLCTPIFSHIKPSFYLAKILEPDHTIFYSTSSREFDSLITERGYNSVPVRGSQPWISTDCSDADHLNQEWSFLFSLQSIISRTLVRRRKTDLGQVVTEINPDIIFIDVFCSVDMLILLSLNLSETKLCYFNPMLSLNNFNRPHLGLTTVKNLFRCLSTRTRSMSSTRDRIILYLGELDLSIHASRLAASLTYYKDVTITVKQIPQIILGPAPLDDLVENNSGNTYYLGLCIERDLENKASETQTIARSAPEWDTDNTDRIIYCSFGTYYKGPNRPLIGFVEKLLAAISRISGVKMIVAANEIVIGELTNRNDIPHNVFLCEFANQLDVLSKASLFITHGGLGSIKESIYSEVPLLVYPLDFRYDQPFNADKILRHGLGLAGSLHGDCAVTVEEKILDLLSGNRYVENVRKFKKMCSVSQGDIQTTFNEIFASERWKS